MPRDKTTHPQPDGVQLQSELPGEKMIAEILATGNELLTGALVDTNSAYISDKLAEIGIRISRHTLVGDTEGELDAVFRELSHRADIVIVTGGLGPTRDDLSREIAARSAGVELVEDAACLKKIEEFFNSRGRECPANNQRQAQFPQGSEILENPIGTAPGFACKIDRATFYFMPGVPAEMRKMLKEQVMPRLTAILDDPYRYRCRTISCFGIGESALEDKLEGFIERFPEIELGFRASFPELQIKLYQKDQDKKRLLTNEEQALQWIKERIGRKLVSEDGTSMAAVVGELLRKKNATLAVAESCTGGLLANLLTNTAGSSDYFLLAAVTYANEAKEKVLKVDPEILKKFGAVHEETATAMAAGAREIAGSTYAVSTTGIAGPAGGTPDKPVGTVCIGLAGPAGVKAKRYFFPFGKRLLNKKIFTAQTLDLLRKELLSDL